MPGVSLRKIVLEETEEGWVAIFMKRSVETTLVDERRHFNWADLATLGQAWLNAHMAHDPPT